MKKLQDAPTEDSIAGYWRVVKCFGKDFVGIFTGLRTDLGVGIRRSERSPNRTRSDAPPRLPTSYSRSVGFSTRPATRWATVSRPMAPPAPITLMSILESFCSDCLSAAR